MVAISAAEKEETAMEGIGTARQQGIQLQQEGQWTAAQHAGQPCCCGFILPCCSCFNYSFIFPNIFFIFLILFSLYSLTLYCFLSFFLSFLFFSFLFFSFLFFFSAPRSLRDLGSQARGQAQAPVVEAPSPNYWTKREIGRASCRERVSSPV